MTERLKGVFGRWCEYRRRFNGADADAREAMRADGDALEAELAEALAAEPSGIVHEGDADVGEDAEARERRRLRGLARVGGWFSAAISGRQVDGAEHEYAAAAGVTDGRMPVDVLERARPADPERRAVTPAPATTAVQMMSIVPALFQRSVAPFLGIDMPQVAIGTPAYPYLTTSVTAGMKAKAAAAAETAGAISVATATPRRLTGSFRFNREDAVRLEGLEEALRMNLESVMSDQFDDQVLNGDGVAPNLDGLLHELTNPVAPAANAETLPRYATALSSHVDGLHAYSNRDIRALVGVGTYAHMSGVIQADGTESAASYVERVYGGLRTTNRIAAAVGHIQQAVIRRGMEARVALAPVWSGVEFIRDPYGDAGKGEVVVTALTLIGGLAFVRKSAFVQDSFRIG